MRVSIYRKRGGRGGLLARKEDRYWGHSSGKGIFLSKYEKVGGGVKRLERGKA